jgi:hypothetical protein
MTRFHKRASWGLLWLTLSAAASATSLTVASQTFNIDGGGQFSAYLGGNSLEPFSVYCVDYRGFVSPPQAFDVNIDTLSTTDADARYGSTPQGSFSYADAPDGMSFGDAFNRYLLAGYLITQYDLSLNANTGSKDIGIQNAIWNILNTNDVNHTDGDVVTWENNAVVWASGLTAGEKKAFAADILIYSSTVISPNSDLNNNDSNNRYVVGQQEMMQVVPEPAVLAMVGSGLIALGLLRRRAVK